ncbi:MAG: aspartate aminotransferase family protein [Lachnospiraceae bacterium]|nr:aspartate aminotransferase family protein [Lachnospiraceae bacterium]MBQ1721911.1 aspartate aminotransferase family protein [Lachnospiraceae bacterium]MBQ2317523.1 aspartate aminotransferase family protein [Lachnospiraceae bacterium]MBQ2504065.1 aspartate aminotransferase family protein [Lachnospiraceae bacterium]MBQ5386802.1 aspartate aminotransferase family protein [Lachnospiraceae bacterium]
MTKQDYIDEAEQVLFHVYNRFPVVFDHGEGVYLYDTDGKDYLDFASGIGVMAFGYGNRDYNDALTKQIGKILHTSNLYYHPSLVEAGEKLVRISRMDKAFFTNSGAEAIEGAIKVAKKYAYLRDGHAGHEVIAMEHSFHGRTVGALSVTGTDHYREPFYPLMDGVKFATFNDLDSVKQQVTTATCAILLEPLQGEGGIYPATKEFLEGLRQLCDEKDILLIFDEIQCGMGRTGAMYTWQHYGVKPDIMTTAKALGGGVPVGAFLVTNRVAEASLVPGDHGTTYGGNPFVCAAVSKSIDLMEELQLPEHVQQVTPYLEEALEQLSKDYAFVLGYRGMGFMQGLLIDPKVPVGEIVAKCLEAGLVVLSAGGNVLRLLPPLIITETDVDEMVRRMRPVLDTFVET